MKRMTLALLSVFLITPCFANIHISSNGVEITVKQKISGADAQVAALAEYNAQIKNAGGQNAGIPAAGVWQVCKAAGWDITKPDGESRCQDFVNALMKYATWKFRALCGEDNIFVKNGFGRCIDDVFSNKVLGGTKVNQLIANGLAKEYARIKFADNNLACSKKIRQTTLPPDDYVQCISMDKNMAYEFRFDSVTETTDYVINEGTESGVCKIFGLKYSLSGVGLNTNETWPAACETTDAAICSKVNESMSRFGRSAKMGTTGSGTARHNACVISGGSITVSNLRTAFGIDNYAFKKGGIQLNANVATQTQVCDWVKKNVTNPQITNCKCNDGFTQLYDFSGMITEVDDVLTCTINGQPVDFVFDDLSESNKKVAKGGAQGMDCMAAGGTYAGEQCINLDEQQCKLLARANLKNCPTCKRVKYQNGVCQLPSGADAENVQKNTNIALIIGGAVVGVTVTVATGGAGAVVVLTGIETVGAAIELGAQLKIDAIADEFLVQSNNCKSASCAKNLIKNNFQHLADSQNDFSAPEISAIDSEMARLANLIPENDDFWVDIALNSLSMSDNQSGIFENWTPEQVWRAVGITLQMASIVTSVGKWIGTKAKTVVTKLSESTKVLKSKTENVVDVVERASSQRALTAKQVELQQRLRVIDPSTLKGDDIELYDLWKKYAPRNQSFDDFKKMGSLQKIRDMSKDWTSWYDVDYVGFLGHEIESMEAKLQEVVLHNPDIRADYVKLSSAEFNSKYPGVLEQEQRLIDFQKALDDFEKSSGLRYGENFEGNYSTYNPNLKSIKSDYDAEMKLWNTNKEKLDAAGVSKEASQILENYIDTNKQLANNYAVIRLADEVPLENVDEVAKLRADQMNMIIDGSPKLSDMRNKFSSLTDSQKIEFAQEISDELLHRNGAYSALPSVSSKSLEDGTSGSFHSYRHKIQKVGNEDYLVPSTGSKVYIDLRQTSSFGDFINTLAHEDAGHAIDYVNPNAGSLGAQAAYVEHGVKGGNYDLYRKELSEQSAWRIGDVVEMANKPENPFKTFVDIYRKVVKQQLKGTRIIDANTWIPISNYSGMFADNLQKGKIAVSLDYSYDISENLSDIRNMLKEYGLKIFRTSDREYVIGTEEVINSML